MNLLRTLLKYAVILIAIAVVLSYILREHVVYHHHVTTRTDADGREIESTVSSNYRFFGRWTDPEPENPAEMTQKDYPITAPFTRVVACDLVDVYIYDAPRDKIVVKTPADQDEIARPEVINGELHIRGRGLDQDGDTPTVVVFRRGINDIEHRGRGIFQADHLTGPHIAVSNTGNADMTIGGEGQDALLVNTGSGDITVSWLNVTRLTVNMSGSGDVEPTGTWTNLLLNHGGTGYFTGDSIHPAAITAQVTDSGICFVGLAQTLNATVQGEGILTYSGNPTSVVKNISGKGSIGMDP